MTLRELVHLNEGHEADTYEMRALLTGIFNRLGSGSSSPAKCPPPAWISERAVASTKEQIAMARDLFKEYVRKQG